MQGSKGVGRYAASILGTDLFLETVTIEGEKTTVYMEWSNFEDAQYLDDVDVLIETAEVSEPSGTRLTMTGDNKLLADWNQKQFDDLRFELKKLISPVSSTLNHKYNRDRFRRDRFRIGLTVGGFPDVEDVAETIEPFPIFDLFDYKIAGKISTDGKGTLTYSSQKARNTIEEIIQFDAGGPTDCGELDIDIRVYDRDKDAIDSLIGRGLKDEFGNYVGKLQARQLLNESNGIGVYRNGFRIRPLGDPEFDWLKLNEQRVQNPSRKIGSKQAMGYVQIQSDEQSGLIEKSARDGLRENAAFSQLKEITKKVIAELETRRFDYRMKAGLSRSAIKVERDLERIFSFDELKQDISKRLSGSGIDQRTSDKIIDIISREEEDKNKIADEIRQAVAIYQGQATLGKIINVILHEGRGPLNYFRSQIPNLRYWYKSFRKTEDPGALEESLSIVEGIDLNADFFVNLFNKLDPLAARNRSKKSHSY